ncbi:hypothetical protein SSX86_008005 [Deinandra increscens subsp. villosa]|uniref:Uncharacterized protein n=1 Tax=Deinandra increscens subsp. villosa TaxID=3103831 RepID=A0AAP0H4P9_9ASTR
MGKVSKESGVLKLVRAGGIVQVYKHPIIAAQIMERYPRHCVTRPDFFRNPCIVVKPESVLRPGKVFFIVPYHTVYRLVKSKGHHFTRHSTTEAVDEQTLENIHHMESYVAAAASGCLKPCLRDNPPDNTRCQQDRRVRFMLPDGTRCQQGRRVRFMLPDEDEDDEKWDSDVSEF